MSRAERSNAETAQPRQLTRLALASESPARAERGAVKSAAGAFGILIVIGALAFLGERKFGLGGLALPLVAAALLVAMRRPTVMFCITIGLTIVCEGSTIDLPVMRYLYSNLYGGIEPITILVVLTFISVALDVQRGGRRLRLPTLPAFTVMLMAFACVDGVAVAHGVGVGVKTGVLALTPLIELILVILSVYNLNLTNEQIVRLLRWGLAFGAAKAVMGLIVMSLGLSADVDTGTTITYYEPTANWLGLMTILGLLAAGLGDGAAARTRLAGARERLRQRTSRRGAHDRPLIDTHTTWLERRRAVLNPVGRADSPAAEFPSRATTTVAHWLRSRWGVLVFALAFACLLLSYRRSFWIGATVAMLILIPLASTPRKRLMIIPVLILVAGAVWTIQAVGFQAVTPIVKRANSLQPGALDTNPEDRYRLDERANVVAEIKSNPLVGIGVTVPWVATVRSLGIEHPDGRDYVHFALLYWWLKTGVLGAAFYIGFLIAMATLAFQTWRGHVIREFRCFGLASLCAVFALAAIETTASFTGVDPRFSVLIGAQFGLLAVLAARRSDNTAELVEPRLVDQAERSRSHLRRAAWPRRDRTVAARRPRTARL
jgi:O-Antigen ligase